MLTPDYLLHISEGAEEIAAQMHTDMLKRIVAHIQARQKRGDTYILTAADKWQLEALQDAGYLRNDLAEDIALYTNLQADEIRQAMEDAGVRTMAYDDRIYQQAGIADTKQPLSPYMERLMQRNYEATMHEWSNYTRTTADAAQDWFVSAMDRVYNQVTFGGVGYIQAFAETIDDLAKTGLYINYPSGHRDTIETATLRCVRTGVSQATAQIQERRMDEMGVDLVLVSSHQGARPSHQVWQGKVYSRSGASPKYPDFISNTHYGSGDGLCGWNCRHQFMPFIEGMHNPFLRYDNKENRELYEATQTQRSMERSVRRTKRNLEVLKAAQDGDPDHADQYESGIAKLKERLKLQRGAYYDFCEKKDLRPLPERMRIAKAGRARPHDNVQVDFVKPNMTGGDNVYMSVNPNTTINVPEFAQAKTIAEAQEYAERFVSQYKSKYSGNVSYKGIDIDVANKANKVFDRIFAEYDIEPLRNITPMNMRESRWKDTTADAAYQWIQGGDLFINPKYYKNKKTLEAHIKEGKDLLDKVLSNAERYIASGKAKPSQVEYLRALMSSERQCVAQSHDYVESTIVHECGHMLDDKLFGKILKEQGVNAREFYQESMSKYAQSISGYANSSSKEYIAECFTAYWNGEVDKLDPKIIKLFEDAKNGKYRH